MTSPGPFVFPLTTTWPLEGFQGPIETWTSGWYISSLLEHGLRARRALYRPCPSTLTISSSIYDWTGFTHETRKAAQLEGITTVGDLTEIRAFGQFQGERTWSYWALTKPCLELHTRQNAVPTGTVLLAIGQSWQVLTSQHEPEYVLEITGFSSPTGIWYTRWWKPKLLTPKPPRDGLSLQRRDQGHFAQFSTLFPDSACFRQVFLDLPTTTTLAGVPTVTRTLLRWKQELRPCCPPTPPPRLLSPRIPPSPDDFQVYMGQHRKILRPWHSVLSDNPVVEIWGSVVIRQRDPAGTDTWTGYRFQFTEASGKDPPSEYMIWTLLAYWAFHSPLLARDPTYRETISPCFNLVSRINSGTNAKKWGKTQQGFLAALIRSTFLSTGWSLTHAQCPRSSHHIEAKPRSLQGLYVARMLAMSGAEGCPTWAPTTVHTLPFADIQRLISSPTSWTWLDLSTNLFALTDTVAAHHSHNRQMALVDRDADRESRGAPKKWSTGNSISFAARALHLELQGVAARAAHTRSLHERHYTVGSNQTKGRKLTDQQRIEIGACKLCGQPDSYDHFIRCCDYAPLLTVRCAHQTAMHDWALSLSSPEREISQEVLRISRDTDGYRVVLGNWSGDQQARLESFDSTLDYKEALSLMRKLFNRFQRMYHELWRIRCAGLGHKVYYPRPARRRSKFYVVKAGKIPGLYYDYHDALEQISGVSCAIWKSFNSLVEALAYQQTDDSTSDPTLPPPLYEIFTDGSFSNDPDRAGWAFVAVARAEEHQPYQSRKRHHHHCESVCLNPSDSEYLGADHLSNNTAELSAIGQALRWIQSPQAPVSSDGTTYVCLHSDSQYALNMTKGLSRPTVNKKLVKIVRQLYSSLQSIIDLTLTCGRRLTNRMNYRRRHFGTTKRTNLRHRVLLKGNLRL